MRISTNSIFEAGTTQLGSLQTQLARTQQQLSTNRRMLTAADDPIASARALEVTQSQSINTQFVTNRQNARASLSQEELALQGATNAVQNAQELVVRAGNPALSQSDRESLGIELSGLIEDMVGVANRDDGTGGFLFGGYKSSTQPFTQTASGATYNGDQGARQLQVASARQMPISDSGSAVFENNVTGNGSFKTRAGAGNAGTGVISSGLVADGAKVTGHTYSLAFAVGGTPAATTYTVTDTTTGATVPPAPAVAAQPFQSNQQITVDGQAFSIAGAPADGDKFTLEPSQKESVFATMTNLLAALRAPVGPGSSARLTNSLNTANEGLGSALDTVLGVRSSLGSRMKELDTLDSAGDDLDIQYTTTLSNLQDLDMVKAISSFSQQQMTLEAAQKSFKSMSGLSLFNFIS
jgi:flagellar hook-associated protein 3 FlgL